MKQITKLVATAMFLLFGVWSMNAQTETVFHETFDQFTVDNPDKNALTSSLTDETGYVVGGGGSNMKCSETGALSLNGGRFTTKNLDLTGEEVTLYVTYKLSGVTTKRFQIDIDKTGTSGMGGILNEAGGDSPTSFTTKSFSITTGTESSYIHLRTESDHTIIIDEIKITKKNTSTNVDKLKIEGITFDGQIIRNNTAQKLQVYDISGHLITASDNDIDMSGKAKGIYIVKAMDGVMKINIR